MSEINDMDFVAKVFFGLDFKCIICGEISTIYYPCETGTGLFFCHNCDIAVAISLKENGYTIGRKGSGVIVRKRK